MPGSNPPSRRAPVERLSMQLAVSLARRRELPTEAQRLLDEAAARLRRTRASLAVQHNLRQRPNA